MLESIGRWSLGLVGTQLRLTLERPQMLPLGTQQKVPMVAGLWVLRQVWLGQGCIFSFCFAEKGVFQQRLHILLILSLSKSNWHRTSGEQAQGFLSLPYLWQHLSFPCLLSAFPIPCVPAVFLCELVCCLSVSLPGTPCHAATAIPVQSSFLHSQSPELLPRPFWLSLVCMSRLASENILHQYIS